MSFDIQKLISVWRDYVSTGDRRGCEVLEDAIQELQDMKTELREWRSGERRVFWVVRWAGIGVLTRPVLVRQSQAKSRGPGDE